MRCIEVVCTTGSLSVRVRQAMSGSLSWAVPPADQPNPKPAPLISVRVIVLSAIPFDALSSTSTPAPTTESPTRGIWA